MMSFIQGIVAGHLIPALLAGFIMLSAILSAVSAFLIAIGDKVPDWLSKLVGAIAGAVNFINGNFKKQ